MHHLTSTGLHLTSSKPRSPAIAEPQVTQRPSCMIRVMRPLTTCRAEPQHHDHAPPGPRPGPISMDASRRNLLVGGLTGGLSLLSCPCCQAKASSITSGVPLLGRVGWYDELFAYLMATSMEQYETAIKPIKERLMSSLVSSTIANSSDRVASGDAYRVLEIGMGTGPNIKYLTNALTQQLQGSSVAALPLQLVGLDPNVAMQGYARQAAEAAGLQPSQLQLVEGDAGSMPWPDNSFDAVVCTLVLCSVPAPANALAEVKRVLRPGGRFMFIEHVAADWNDKPWWRMRQELLNPLQQLLADGCNLNRTTGRSIERAGFSQVQLEDGLVKGLASLGPVDSLIATHVWGLAVK